MWILQLSVLYWPSLIEFLSNDPRMSSIGIYTGLILMWPGNGWVWNQLVLTWTWLMSLAVVWKPDFSYSCCHSWHFKFLMCLLGRHLTLNNTMTVISIFLHLSVVPISYLKKLSFFWTHISGFSILNKRSGEIWNVLNCQPQ